MNNSAKSTLGCSLLPLAVLSFSKPLLRLAPEVLLAKPEPIVESLEAIGSNIGAKGGRVGGGSQPVGRGGSPEAVGGLQPRVEEVEAGEGVVVPILDCLGSLRLPRADHLYKKFKEEQHLSLW